MSGDVQPRKRKDKKKKKDELGVEEPRGTAAVLGEGDVFMHSYHEHGTGGHWCAKIIFFSLLAVLLTLIGLIILENRGLSELEANAVESRYSGVLEGWLEDAPDDDHHDEHTLELKHHDDDEDDNEEAVDDHDDDIDHDDDDHGDDDENDSEQDHYDEGHEDEDHEDDEDQNQDDENEQDDEDDQELEPADDEDDDGGQSYNEYFRAGDDDDDDEDQDEEKEDERYTEEDDDEDNNLVDENNDESDEKNDDDDDNEVDRNYFEGQEADESRENEDEDEHEEEEEEEDTEIEVEHIEKEVSEEEPISLDLPTLPEDDDDDDEDKHDDKDENEEDSVEDDDEEFLEADDEPPIVERITAPAGKPFVEVEEEDSSEQPPDTLEEEEEYEKQQEELRREEEQASHMWLKLVVGGALLVATHAVVRRATAGASRDEPEQEERDTREETPLIDRRMTLIPEEPSKPVAPKKVFQEPVVEEVAKKIATNVKSAPLPKQESDEEDEQQEPEESEEEIEEINKEDEEKELYSDEELEEEEEIVEVKKEMPKKSLPVAEVKKETPKKYVPVIEAKKEMPKQSVPVKEKIPEPDDDVPDDVEIIDEEQLEEELEEEDEEEEISDVDDVELLSRLEAKYGRLPEPERPGQKHKDGGNSIRDEWPGEPSDAYWRQELDSAEREIRQGSWSAAARRVSAAALGGSARARWVAAQALDREAEAKRDNALLSRAIAAYIHLLKMNEQLSDEKLLEIASRTLDRIKFRGNYLSAEPIYRLLIRRFPNDPSYRNNLTISFLMANRADLAEQALKETLRLRPNDRVALAHYGFVLKTEHNKLEEAVEAFQKALEGDKGPACEPRFSYHLGDALLLLGRHKDAHEVHKRGAKLGHFLSPAQRSLYNIERLKSQPWWNVEKTPYARLARSLEKSWRDILREGEAAQTLYEKEKEGLKDRGEWSQLDLFLRGREVPDRCKRAPVTCSIVKAEAAAVGCRRGQIKFSAMEPGTHVRPHVGPTNCRLRMHLGLSNTKDTYIRVDQEIRQWQEGKVLMFDDSFEHEVWHNGTGKRLVLIVDVWHPDITPAERRQLPAI